jgi:hypothetical protein
MHTRTVFIDVMVEFVGALTFDVGAVFKGTPT